jgi:hypothetical protein
MSRQDQNVRDGSIAVQSGENTNIFQGPSPTQIKEIVQATAEALLPSFTQVARQIADDRMKDFETVLLARANDPSVMRSEAFKDPDFQYLLGRAQHAYARSGDHQLRDTLIDLIARRSREEDRTRLSLTLNEAVEKAAVLTKTNLLSYHYHICSDTRGL